MSFYLMNSYISYKLGRDCSHFSFLYHSLDILFVLRNCLLGRTLLTFLLVLIGASNKVEKTLTMHLLVLHIRLLLKSYRVGPRRLCNFILFLLNVFPKCSFMCLSLLTDFIQTSVGLKRTSSSAYLLLM
jgi:hypothetical protein